MSSILDVKSFWKINYNGVVNRINDYAVLCSTKLFCKMRLVWMKEFLKTRFDTLLNSWLYYYLLYPIVDRKFVAPFNSALVPRQLPVDVLRNEELDAV